MIQRSKYYKKIMSFIYVATAILISSILILVTVNNGAASITPNLIANPSFESGTSKPLNWSFITSSGNTPVWDNTISHTGARSMKISIPGINTSRSGYPKSDLIKATPLTNYTVSAWVKTKNASISNPAVRVVELNGNKSWIQYFRNPLLPNSST